MELLKDSHNESVSFYKILISIEKIAETAIAIASVILLAALAAAGIIGFGVIINGY